MFVYHCINGQGVGYTKMTEVGTDLASKFKGGGTISVIIGSQVSLRVQYFKRDEVHFTAFAVTKQWKAKWPFIANAVFRFVQNDGEKSYICRL